MTDSVVSRQVGRGDLEAVLDERFVRARMRALRFTPREEQVAWRLIHGASYGEIAAELRISTNTVKNYIRAAYDKAGLDKQDPGSTGAIRLMRVLHGLPEKVLPRHAA
jgi:DNA-binding CsgD family transcriptional regulator